MPFLRHISTSVSVIRDEARYMFVSQRGETRTKGALLGRRCKSPLKTECSCGEWGHKRGIILFAKYRLKDMASAEEEEHTRQIICMRASCRLVLVR